MSCPSVFLLSGEARVVLCLMQAGHLKSSTTLEVRLRVQKAAHTSPSSSSGLNSSRRKEKET